MWFPTLIKNAEQQLLLSIYLARITANLCMLSNWKRAAMAP